jgi:phage-related protein
MRMSTIMADVERDLSGQGPTPVTIRQELSRRFSVEDINLDSDSLKITQSRNGFTLRINYEERAPYVADIYLLVAFDKSVEIRR